jgi:enamine deaminase RidA (YjgF/YER057c/UK114 family)
MPFRNDGVSAQVNNEISGRESRSVKRKHCPIPHSWHHAPPLGYSHVVRVSGGAVVFIAGQVALDKSGNIVGKDDCRAQLQQVFENLKAAVESAGGTFHDIIKLNSYFLNLSHLSEFREVRDQHVDLKNPPASTAIQVERLFRPEFLVEIEAVAVVPNKAEAITHS